MRRKFNSLGILLGSICAVAVAILPVIPANAQQADPADTVKEVPPNAAARDWECSRRKYEAGAQMSTENRAKEAAVRNWSGCVIKKLGPGWNNSEHGTRKFECSPMMFAPKMVECGVTSSGTGGFLCYFEAVPCKFLN
jgi:hypothetical protein